MPNKWLPDPDGDNALVVIALQSQNKNPGIAAGVFALLPSQETIGPWKSVPPLKSGCPT
jgi:hypothetical protein